LNSDGGVRLINGNEPTKELRVGQHGASTDELRIVPYISGGGAFQFDKDIVYDFSDGSWQIGAQLAVGGIGTPSADLHTNGLRADGQVDFSNASQVIVPIV
jgi:hypothetical protein